MDKGPIAIPDGSAVVSKRDLKGLGSLGLRSFCAHCDKAMTIHDWVIMDANGYVVVMCSEKGPYDE